MLNEHKNDEESPTDRTQPVSLHLSLHENQCQEKIAAKGISKEEAPTLIGQMANFVKIYANTEGFCVMDGSEHGGVFLRSVCKVFKDVNYVTNHKFTEIIFKIRKLQKEQQL